MAAGSKKRAIEFLVQMVNDGIIKIEGQTKKEEFYFKLKIYNPQKKRYEDLNLRAKYIIRG
jgi:hypothetical protein